ncbi:hypothetical protein RHMOL_Rhmol02G0221500 [Rhododendron molle]|uniref:Uncharacterized protein n=1 Tax=Rhododendron molle TaxID=49168 RepID=A0ACC0PV99_RHOML|nr:hypothetical protein RHMOL_Rhmol02G0221500 [Rhododendron molle]
MPPLYFVLDIPSDQSIAIAARDQNGSLCEYHQLLQCNSTTYVLQNVDSICCSLVFSNALFRETMAKV